MKKSVYIFALVLIVAASCTKEEPARNSGVDKIDNIRYMSTTFYVYGFNFSTGKLASTEETPGPDITVDTVSNAPYSVIFQTNNFRPSFSHISSHASESEAKNAFDALKTVSPTTWTDLANPVLPNQIWIYRSGQDRYTKIRIVSIKRGKVPSPIPSQQSVPMVEITFEWVYQADGSLTFP